MDRKQFIHKTGAGTGALVLLGAGQSAATTTQEAAPEAAGRNQRVQQEWIKSLMENLDAQLDEPTRIKLMESCGRACARRAPSPPWPNPRKETSTSF